jgi:hypothetical protein
MVTKKKATPRKRVIKPKPVVSKLEKRSWTIIGLSILAVVLLGWGVYGDNIKKSAPATAKEVAQAASLALQWEKRGISQPADFVEKKLEAGVFTKRDVDTFNSMIDGLAKEQIRVGFKILRATGGIEAHATPDKGT